LYLIPNDFIPKQFITGFLKKLKFNQDILNAVCVLTIPIILYPMKTLRNITLLSLIFLTLSCNSDDNDFSKQDLHGIWEWRIYQEESELFYINTYEFKKDGTFDKRMTARKQDSNIDLGYNSLISGTYTLVGNRLRLTETDFLTTPEGSTTWYTSLENLVGSDWDREIDITVSMKERKSELLMDFPCPPNAFCRGPITFYRVWK